MCPAVFLLFAGKAAILDGLGHMRGANAVATGQIGDGARHLEDAVIGARRQSQSLHRLSEQVGAGRIGLTVTFDFLVSQPGVGLPLPCQLPFACRADTPAHGGGRLAVAGPCSASDGRADTSMAGSKLTAANT